MLILLSFLVMTLALSTSLEHLGQNIGQYWDLVAFSMVIIGTLSVAIMTAPPLKARHLMKVFFQVFTGRAGLREDCVFNALNLIKGHKPNGKVKRIDQKIIVDGLDLLKLGYTSSKLDSLLSRRIRGHARDYQIVSKWIKGLAKYPPAFGIAGTILGLVQLMQNLGPDSNPANTGISMAIALVATFYGVMMANLFISPIADRLNSIILEDVQLSEISLRAIIMISERTNFVEAIEEMNNHLPNRLNPLSFESQYRLLDAG